MEVHLESWKPRTCMSEPQQPTPTPMDPASRRTPPLAWLLLAASAVIVVLWFVVARHYWEDDAWIHLEFARSLAAGRGFEFNGHLVYGDTSPLWVWLLVGAHALVPDWLAAGKLLAALSALGALSGVFFYARSLVRHAGRWSVHTATASTFAATMLLAFVLSPYFGYWAFSGMEALAAAGFACWTCALIAPHHLSWQRYICAALLAGLAPLLRPEMAFFTVLVGLVLVLRVRHMRISLTLRVDLFVAGLLLAAAPAVAWGFYALRTFASVLPNTNAAKRAAPADSVIRRLLDIYAFGYPLTLLACLLLAAWFVWYIAKGRRDGAASLGQTMHAGGWIVFVWSAVNSVFYVANHTFVQTRYIFVTAPVLTVALLALAYLRWPAVYRGLLALTLGFGLVVSLIATRPLVRNKVQINATSAELAAYMRTLPPDAPVALYSIGELAFLSQHPVIDTGGITRPGIIPYLFGSNDDRRNTWIYEQGAQYEVIDHAPVPGSRLVWSRDVPATGWSFNPHSYSASERLQLWQLPGTDWNRP